MKKIEVWIERPKWSGQTLVLSATLELPKQSREILWYHFPADHRELLTEGHDAFLLGTVFLAMRSGSDLTIHGEISPSLLRNLEEFQAAWVSWRPHVYSHIQVYAELEAEQPTLATDSAIGAFSGGVDSCFTLWRHRMGRCGRLQQNLRAGLLIHGLDIPLEQKEIFDRAADNATHMLTSLDVRSLSMATNFKSIAGTWEDAFMAGIASCMIWYQKSFSAGLVGSSQPYHALALPWGSNPITDRMLSSDSFQLIHDGAAYSRTEKVREIAAWPEVQNYLRVCWEGQELDRNCGRCEKCIRTVLNFRALGLARPACLPFEVTDAQILSLKGMHPALLGEFMHILMTAKNSGINETWVRALERTVIQNRRALERSEALLRRIGLRAKRWLRSMRSA